MERAGAAAQRPDPNGNQPLACPACREPMRRLVYRYDSGVWVDACDAHGIWLDHAELDQLRRFRQAVDQGMAITATQRAATDAGRRPPITRLDPDNVYDLPRGRPSLLGTLLDGLFDPF